MVAWNRQNVQSFSANQLPRMVTARFNSFWLVQSVNLNCRTTPSSALWGHGYDEDDSGHDMRYSTNVTFPVLTSSIAPTILISPLSAIPRSNELLTRMRFTASVTFMSATRCTNA